jgi:predicted transcriptional regulator
MKGVFSKLEIRRTGLSFREVSQRANIEYIRFVKIMNGYLDWRDSEIAAVRGVIESVALEQDRATR